MEKQCSKCKKIKKLEEFHVQSNGKFGRRADCKSCRIGYKGRKSLTKEERKQYYENWTEKNKKYIQEYRKKYYQRNKEQFKINRRKYEKSKKKTDISYRIMKNLRSRLNYALKNNSKKGSAIRDLGCTIEELKQHLESQFKPGMSWDNYGLYGWHIDHIKPFAKFDLTDQRQLKKVCHYTNLQPLWAKDNLKKNKY